MERLIKFGLYQHYKGNCYRVLGTCKHADTLEEMVIYKCEGKYGDVWVRSRKTFEENVSFRIPRFRYLKK